MKRTLGVSLVVFLALFMVPVEAADLLLFPSVTTTHQSVRDPELPQQKFVPAIDIFYSTEFSQTFFLAEYLASGEETELERIRFGWHILPGKTLWVGRFHNPISFWNTQNHHGDFLQSSLTRPSIANYEDEYGPLPSHISGFMIESARTSGDAEINYTAGIGIGPSYNSTLHPLNLLNPKQPGKLVASLRLGYHPEVGNPDQFGAAVGYARIPVIDVLEINEVRQSTLSTFLNIERNKFHLIGELFVFKNRVSGLGSTTSSTTFSAYLQPEYKLGESGRTTLFGRIEGTPNAEKDEYLSLFSEFSRSQILLGLRFDLTPSQALKIEAGKSHRLDPNESNINFISAQWSMILPL